MGFEMAVSENSTLGVLARNECKSDRPSFGSSNDNVKNTFSRFFVPWRYSKSGVFKDSFIMQLLIGVEKSKFKTELGSEARVTFIDIVSSFGYQWFWSNGFNVSVLGGPAFLIKNSSKENIVQNESNDVVNFLNDNTKSNIHAGIGVILGWNF